MSIKWNREAVLVTVMAVMILIGLFYYGHEYFIAPVREEAEVLAETVEGQENLLLTYPPSEDLLEEYEENYLETESYLPLGAQANEAVITLEEAANAADVSIVSMTRTADHQSIEQAPEHFVKNTYDVQMTSEAPEAFRAVIGQLMEEERVWNIIGFSYEKVDEDNYTGSLTFELAYYSTEPASAQTSSDEIPEESEMIEETGELGE